MNERGHKVTLLTFNRNLSQKSKEVYHGVKLVRIPYLRNGNLLKVISLLAIIPYYLVHVYKSDIIFIYGGKIIAFEFVILFGKIFKKKVFFRSTMLDEDDIHTLMQETPVILRQLRKRILGMQTYYFSINHEFTERYLEHYAEMKNVLKSLHGVDTSIFSKVNQSRKLELRKKYQISDNCPVLITVGYLIKRKGFEELFEILSKIDIPYYYLIVGEFKVSKSHYMANYNQEMSSVYNLGKKLLGEKVHFVGPSNLVYEYFQASDIYILNSRQEGFPPNSLLESMACGLLPIIRNMEGSEGGIIKHRLNGLFFSDAEQAVELVSEALKDINLVKSLSQNASQTIQAEASFDILYNRLDQILT